MANCTGISTTALILIIAALGVSLISMASNHWSDYELPSTILWVSKYFITISFYFIISKIKALSFSVALFLLKNPKELCTMSVYGLNITHSSMVHPAASENEEVSLSRKWKRRTDFNVWRLRYLPKGYRFFEFVTNFMAHLFLDQLLQCHGHGRLMPDSLLSLSHFALKQWQYTWKLFLCGMP